MAAMSEAKLSQDAAPRAVSVRLEQLQDGTIPLSTLEEAFGPASLGIILVDDLPPAYIELRQRLLSYSSYLANLPASSLSTLEVPSANYLVGWSLGKETLKTGHYDTLKGSYYMNCAFTQDPTLQSAPAHNHRDFPEYTTPNVWPADDVLAGFRSTAEELCTLIIDTAALVARACDRYATVHVPAYVPGTLESVVRTSLTTKARLLHYFPSSPDSPSANENEDDDSWCATHVDHGCLTGLTSAMYVDELAPTASRAAPPKVPWTQILRSSTSIAAHTHANLAGLHPRPPRTLPELAAPPDPAAGLYIRSRSGAATQVSIPRDALAFQTGEALARMTKGAFAAVPHFVRGVKGQGAQGVARNTLAVFTQPNLDVVVDHEAGIDFADFARGVIRK